MTEITIRQKSRTQTAVECLADLKLDSVYEHISFPGALYTPIKIVHQDEIEIRMLKLSSANMVARGRPVILPCITMHRDDAASSFVEVDKTITVTFNAT